MASAAAVATNAAESPKPFLEVDDELNTVGTITSVDTKVPYENGNEDDEDITAARRRTRPTAGDDAHKEAVDDEEEEIDQGLFGSGSEDEEPPYEFADLYHAIWTHLTSL